MLTIGIVIGLAISTFVYLFFFWGTVKQYAVSPDGRFAAEWRVLPNGSATSPPTDTVRIRTRFNPLWHTVLTGELANGPSLTWIDSRTLLVKCGNCGTFKVKCDGCQEFYVYAKETTWREVIIRYGNQ